MYDCGRSKSESELFSFSNENDTVPSLFFVMFLTDLFMNLEPSLFMLLSVAAGVEVLVRLLLY